MTQEREQGQEGVKRKRGKRSFFPKPDGPYGFGVWDKTSFFPNGKRNVSELGRFAQSLRSKDEREGRARAEAKGGGKSAGKAAFLKWNAVARKPRKGSKKEQDPGLARHVTNPRFGMAHSKNGTNPTPQTPSPRAQTLHLPTPSPPKHCTSQTLHLVPEPWSP